MTNTVVHRARARTIGRRLILDVAYSRPSGLVGIIKGVVDRSVAGAVLVPALPVIGVCAAIVRASSPGAAIVKQTRVREHGRTFTMYTLRTTTVDAEDRVDSGVHLDEAGTDARSTITRDPRVTRVGGWLRRFSLDELPQLWNVVRGDMSLVGPRPGLPSEVALYDSTALRRLVVKPGLTGLWQLNGRSDLSWDETVWIDHDYVDNWRPGRDVAIALRTVKAVLSKDGTP
jgi:lipopolysaccharide/colanic/teichoic acid biosynthesis glycosyltransferase